jgi:hypothetical protein
MIQDYLPWRTLSNCEIFALPYRKGAPVQRAIGPIADPSLKFTEVASHEMLAGDVFLATYFEGSKQPFDAGEYWIAWSLTLSDFESRTIRRYRGIAEMAEPPKTR